MSKREKGAVSKQFKYGQLTRGALRLVKFLYLENSKKVYLGGKVVNADKQVFEEGVKIKNYKKYIAGDGEKYNLRKFILPNGDIFLEDIARDINWGYGRENTVYTALKNGKGEWLKETWWTRVGGGPMDALHDFTIEDKT